jgi:hypothetical protein
VHIKVGVIVLVESGAGEKRGTQRSFALHFKDEREISPPANGEGGDLRKALSILIL